MLLSRHGIWFVYNILLSALRLEIESSRRIRLDEAQTRPKESHSTSPSTFLNSLSVLPG